MNNVSFHETDASCDMCTRRWKVARIVFRVLSLEEGRESVVINLCDSCCSEFVKTAPQATAYLGF